MFGVSVYSGRFRFQFIYLNMVLAAVLTSAEFIGTLEASTPRLRHSPTTTPHTHRTMEDENAWKREMWQTTRNILSHEHKATADCCPTIEEWTAPFGGTNRAGLYVELYKDVNTSQTFYEYSCDKDVVDKPCRFVDYRLHNISRCVQKYSYAYALVKDPSEGNKPRDRNLHSAISVEGGWMLDHIKIRNGCSCEIITSPFKKHKKLNERHRQKHFKEKIPRRKKNDQT